MRRAKARERRLELQRFVDRFAHELLDRRFAPRTERAAAEAAAEALHTGESHVFEDEGFAFVENRDLRRPQDLPDFFHVPALVVVIPKHGHDRNPARAQVIGQLLGFHR